MAKADILIIGSGPAGIVAATTAKKNYPTKQVTLIRKEKKEVIPCGIPYVFHKLNSVDEDLMSVQSMDKGISLVIGEMVKIKPDEKKVILKNGDSYGYDKLILAIGSSPQLIPMPGIEKQGVWLIKKEYDYLKIMRKAILGAKNVVIIGGGFIGVEIAEELSGIKSISVSIIEMLDHCLISNFDKEFALAAEEKLKNKGVKIYNKTKVKSIGGDKKKAEYVELENGKKIPADAVILSIGAKPNIDLAREAEIKIEEKGGIWVDEYLRTNLLDIFAVGDCAQTKDFITGKNIPMMLASIATSEARIAANNLYGLKLVRENKGTLGVFSTSIDGLVLAAVGITEQKAKEEKFEYIAGEAQAPNRHPAALPGGGQIKVKLIFAKSSENLLLGGGIMGPESVGEMINILALAIQQKVSLFDFITWQIATHPLLTSAPTVYPLINAAQDAMGKIKL